MSGKLKKMHDTNCVINGLHLVQSSVYTYMSCARSDYQGNAFLEKYYAAGRDDTDAYGVEELELAVVTQDFLMHINSPHRNAFCICDKCAEYQRRIGKLERCVKN